MFAHGEFGTNRQMHARLASGDYIPW